MSMFSQTSSFVAAACCALFALACGEDSKPNTPNTHGLSHTLFVVGDGKLKAFDIATGAQRSGEIPNVTAATDLTALEDGHLIANLTSESKVLIVDGLQMLEHFRI